MAALDGLRILDLTQYEAGPSATQALAWMGAEVVKVERPGVGEPGRPGGGAVADSDYFMHWNSNKRSLAVDMASPDGYQLLMRMVPNFDVVVENFGPGVADKLGLSYAELQAVHPSVIYASVKGFGSFGPYADFKCFDGIAMAMAGAFSVTGLPGEAPLPPGPTMGDVGTGMQLALAILAAYIQKQRTGEGQRIEVAMQEAMLYYLRTRLAIGGNWGDTPAPRAGTGRGALIQLYACHPGGPNDYIYVMAVTEPMFGALCKAIGRPELLQDERFATNRGRIHNGDELRAIVGEWAASQTKDAAMRTMAAAGVPCGMVLDTSELYDDPHLNERGFVHEIDHPERGKVRTFGWAPRMSASSVEITPAPQLGAHTDEILAAELGLSSAELAELRNQAIIG
jgi:crotonobetainyl-CoA:carnitine CoA-transferase CaiB-like acyl-CoA transferase